MRAIEVRKRQGKQGLREIRVGTSREGKGREDKRGKFSLGG